MRDIIIRVRVKLNMKHRKSLLKLIIIIWTLVALSAIYSYYFRHNFANTSPLEILTNILFVLFACVSLLLIKANKYTYYNNGVVAFFSLYILVNTYIVVNVYLSTGTMLSLISLVAKFGTSVLFYVLLYIRKSDLIRYKKIHTIQ